MKTKFSLILLCVLSYASIWSAYGSVNSNCNYPTDKSGREQSATIEKTAVQGYFGPPSDYGNAPVNRFDKILIWSMIMFFLAGALIVSYHFKKKYAKKFAEYRNSFSFPVVDEYLEVLKELAELAYVHSENEILLHEKFNNVIVRQMRKGVDVDEICRLLDHYNNDLSVKLRSKHPDLTPKDIQVCCLLASGFSSQQICTLTKFKTVRSLYVRKSRLKEKLNLKPNETINSYLTKI